MSNDAAWWLLRPRPDSLCRSKRFVYTKQTDRDLQQCYHESCFRRCFQTLLLHMIVQGTPFELATSSDGTDL